MLAAGAGRGKARVWAHRAHRLTSPLNSHTRDSLWSRNARRSGPMSMLSVSKVALQQIGGSQILLQGCPAGGERCGWAGVHSVMCRAARIEYLPLGMPFDTRCRTAPNEIECCWGVAP